MPPGASAAPLVGMGYRAVIAPWILRNLSCFETLEVTLDHVMFGGAALRDGVIGLVGRLPLTAHGIGLSLGTDAPCDEHYLERIADLCDALRVPWYSEHLAFTGVPGRELANLLPLPRTAQVAEQVIGKIRVVQSHLPVPLVLENITYLFDYPDSAMSDGEFFNLICGETGAYVLLDVENLYLNGRNHGFDPRGFIDELPAGRVKAIHAAGGVEIDGVSVDSHDRPVPEGALALLDYALIRQSPDSVIVERDRRLEAGDEILADVARVKRHVARARAGDNHVHATAS